MLLLMCEPHSMQAEASGWHTRDAGTKSMFDKATSHCPALQNSGGFGRPSTQSRNRCRMLIAAFTSRFHNIRDSLCFYTVVHCSSQVRGLCDPSLQTDLHSACCCTKLHLEVSQHYDAIMSFRYYTDTTVYAVQLSSSSSLV